MLLKLFVLSLILLNSVDDWVKLVITRARILMQQKPAKYATKNMEICK